MFVGDQACGECHKKQFASHGQSGMAMAMEPVAGSLVLNDNPKLSMRVGPYTYEIKRNGKQSFYSVTDGKETISFPIVLCLWAGQDGPDLLIERDGKFYESLVSFYRRNQRRLTLRSARRAVCPLAERCSWSVVDDNEVANCFSCHSTGAVVSGSQLRLDKFTHGVRCEACHGPGGRHIAAVKEGDTPSSQSTIRGCWVVMS